MYDDHRIRRLISLDRMLLEAGMPGVLERPAAEVALLEERLAETDALEAQTEADRLEAAAANAEWQRWDEGSAELRRQPGGERRGSRYTGDGLRPALRVIVGGRACRP